MTVPRNRSIFPTSHQSALMMKSELGQKAFVFVTYIVFGTNTKEAQSTFNNACYEMPLTLWPDKVYLQSSLCFHNFYCTQTDKRKPGRQNKTHSPDVVSTLKRRRSNSSER